MAKLAPRRQPAPRSYSVAQGRARIIRPSEWHEPLPASRSPRRVRPSLGVMIAFGITFGSLLIAARVTQVLLTGVHFAPLVVAQQSQPSGATAYAGAISALSGNALTVAVGGTQSIDGLVLTVSDLRISTGDGVVGAPPGYEIAIFTVHLTDTNPAGSVTYNAYDFVMTDQPDAIHHEDFAALDHPLGTGTLWANAQVTGQIGFVVRTPTGSGGRDPFVVYLPNGLGKSFLRWSVPLSPSSLP